MTKLAANSIVNQTEPTNTGSLQPGHGLPAVTLSSIARYQIAQDPAAEKVVDSFFRKGQVAYTEQLGNRISKYKGRFIVWTDTGAEIRVESVVGDGPG